MHYRFDIKLVHLRPFGNFNIQDFKIREVRITFLAIKRFQEKILSNAKFYI
jgi:hypothetical protein